MTTKHTPGPWLFRGKSSSVHAAPQNAHGENYTYGAELFRFHDYDDPVTDISDENLALILAAPDLLAACEMLAEAQRRADAGERDGFWCYVDAVDKARAAIAKAKGGT